MGSHEENIAFDRSKIYENLDYQPEPPGYSGKLPWKVQQQIAATNGVQYIDRIGKLTDYPQYELPVAKVPSGLMLDIGNGWGRWLVAGAKKGYIPVGADIRLEFCKVARETLQAQGLNGYTVVADLKDLPFADDVFDLVWSFSVIQHTHKNRLLSCLKHIKRILKPGGYTKLEFPNKNGIHNYFGPAKKFASVANDYQSWEVRYYTTGEYRQMFMEIFNRFSYSVHSMLGIGVLKEDLQYVSVKNKLLCGISLIGTALAKIITPLKTICDSIYIVSGKEKKEAALSPALKKFMEAHHQNPANNLNIVHLLQCPITGEPLEINAESGNLLTCGKGFMYPVVDGIPIMIACEAKQL